MRIKRPWTISLAVAAIGILGAACGGIATTAPTEAPTGTAQGAAATSPAVQAGSTVPTEPAVPQTSSSGRAWDVSTVDTEGAKPSLAIAPDGTLHIAFILEAEPGFLKHSVLTAGVWETSTVATGYFYGPLDLAVDGQGRPHISWHNHDTENEGYAVLTDGEWELHDVDHPGHDGWDNNLAVDSNGVPHIVSIDPSQFGSDSGVEYATLDAGSAGDRKNSRWTLREPNRRWP